jgi:PAS domain S-box-containing protein
MPLTTDKAQQFSRENRFELLVEAITDYAIYMLDLEGFITTWNSGAERIKGYAAEEIIGQHFSRFFTAEDQANRVPDRIMAEARAKGRHEAEGWRVRRDGSRFWTNAILQTVHDGNGALIGFAKITRDMTERHRAREALAQSEHRFRMLVEGVVDYAIYLLDPSGIITNWNTGAERLKGYTADEIVGQHFSKFYTKEDRTRGLPGRVLETAAREGRYEAEGWRVRKDGSRFWASVVVDAIRNDKGALEGFAKITRDISERKAALDAVHASERQFRLLVVSVTDYALFMLDPNGIVTSWNAGAQRIKGYTADEIIGQHFSRFYTERERAAGIPSRALYTARQEGRFEAEGWRVRKDGSLFWASVVIDPIRDEQGEVVGFAKITRDITERRDIEQALAEAREQRAQAQKMDALGQLTGSVAHDFNNLLTVVSGHIQIIRQALADNPRLAHAAEAIALAAKRGETLTRQLLTFARRQPFNPTVISLDERVEEFRTMLAGSLGGGVKLIATVEPGVWRVKVDANELELALVNIALNARDAMPNGGIVSVVAENVTLSRGALGIGIEGEFVALRISDTGCGIAPDLLPKVFEPFFTTKQANKGSGLGLSQVYGFAHESAGAVTIESELGKGTTVTLYLPRTLEPMGSAQADPDAGNPGDGVVLLVEDDPDVAAATVSMLETLGYRVQAVPDAGAALEAIGKRDFDLVVSDIVMAGAMDGIALASAIKERKPRLPVLLVTGYAPSGADMDFTILRKPFYFADLSRVVSSIIAESKQPPGTNIVRLRDVRMGAAPSTEDR